MKRRVPTVVLTVVLVLVLVLAGCATTPDAAVDETAVAATTVRPAVETAQTPTDSAATIRETYDRGFRLVMESVPQDSQDHMLRALAGIRRFREQRVRWAELRDGQYFALEPGDTKGGWIAVVPPESEGSLQAEATLQIDANESITALLIRPRPLTDLWAGIFLAHELSHLADRVLDVEPLNPTRREFLEGEFRAYYLEYVLAAQIGGTAFTGELDRILNDWQPESSMDVLRSVDAMFNAPRSGRQEPEEILRLDAAMASPPSLSESESGMRAGFYMMALVIHYVGSNDLTADAVLEVLDEVHPVGGSEG